jgi:hypothetical protein
MKLRYTKEGFKQPLPKTHISPFQEGIGITVLET